jgi:hypothetical protein
MDIESYSAAVIEELRAYGVDDPSRIENLTIWIHHVFMKGAPAKRAAYDIARRHGIHLTTPRPDQRDLPGIEDYQAEIEAILRADHGLRLDRLQHAAGHLVAHGFDKGAPAASTAEAIARKAAIG